jgi:hypothetical protein
VLAVATGVVAADAVSPTGTNAVIGAAALAGVAACLAGTAWTPPYVPPLAAAFVVARWLGFDPYYEPYRQRASDGGLFSAGWIAVLVVASLAVGAAIARRRSAWPAALPVLLLDAFTALAADAGH